MSKAFNTLVTAVERMYTHQASKYESLVRVYNGLVSPLGPVDQIGIATEIINKAVTGLKDGEKAEVAALRQNLDELLEAATELDAVIKETEIIEAELTKNPI